MDEPRQRGSETVKSHHGFAWGLGGGIIASLCCLGPIVAVLLGLSGASTLFSVTNYRPYFLVAGLVLTAGGVALALRRSRSCCPVQEHRRNLWRYPTMALVTFAFFYGTFSYLLPALLPALRYENQTPPSSANVRVAFLLVDGMT